ncbi:putative hAT family C-terminal dimerisation region [Lyophyllum shimeji]|uniref:HAT family C-terminal dimerisation region n=1 Tax=Lyophyllum shimeji TaxID=47721 RepID=A0A9P3US80_LYOSH|nr:putative hAT family C-terminal dimerisation region [Lyophyllum shimeji]
MIIQTQHRYHGAREDECFFTGATSSLRKHISRSWESHGPIYLAKCEKNGVTPNPRALGDDEADEDEDQANLDGFVHAAPKWTREGLLEHVMQFVVEDDQAFTLVEKDTFRRILKYQRPATKDSDIPRRTKLQEEIMYKAGLVQRRLCERFKDITSEFSVTFDAWTSKSYDPYLAVTVHYIDAPNDKPNEWELKSEILGFTEIRGNHGGANTAATMMKVIDTYGIREKLGWVTGDNVGVNDRACRSIQRAPGVDRRDRPWKARQRRGRCMEHIVHLGAKAFIEALHPKKFKIKKTAKRGTAVAEDSDTNDDNDDEEDEEDEEWTADWAVMDNLPEGQEIDEPIDFDPGDLIGKVLAMINQRKLTLQRSAKKKGCHLLLIKWVRTRWGSMFDLIDRVITNRAAINKFCAVADDSNKVPNLKNKKYADYKISPEEWDMLELIREVLQEPRDAQAQFSSETMPTVARTLPILECLQERWENFADLFKFARVKAAIMKGLEKIRKWYTKTDDSDMYFICLALDPSIKVEYCKNKWDKKYFDAGMKSFNAAFDVYAKRSPSTPPPAKTGSKPDAASDSPAKGQGYGSSWLRAALRPRVEKEVVARDPRQELKDYLDCPLERDLPDPIRWWGHHASQYPILARMARDYLAIQGSSVPSERAFSSGGLTGTLLRNQLTPKTFEALQILKSGYKHGIIKADEEALAHEPKVWTVDDQR